MCKICALLSYFQQLRTPTLMLQLFGLLFACGRLKFKLPLITTTAASWTGEKGRLERALKQMHNIFKVLVAVPCLTSMQGVTGFLKLVVFLPFTNFTTRY